MNSPLLLERDNLIGTLATLVENRQIWDLLGIFAPSEEKNKKYRLSSTGKFWSARSFFAIIGLLKKNTRNLANNKVCINIVFTEKLCIKMISKMKYKKHVKKYVSNFNDFIAHFFKATRFLLLLLLSYSYTPTHGGF